MKMKFSTLFLLFLFIAANCNSQDTRIDIFYGKSQSKFRTYIAKTRNQSENLEFGDKFHLAISNRLYKNIYLKSRFGFNHPRARFKYEFDNKTYNGIYSRDQFFFSINPEYRLDIPFLSMYINSGIGFYHNVRSGFVDRFDRNTEGGFLHNANGEDKDPNRGRARFGWDINLGFSFNFKNFGILMNMGYLNVLVPHEYSSPGIGFQQFSLEYGISYLLQPHAPTERFLDETKRRLD